MFVQWCRTCVASATYVMHYILHSWRKLRCMHEAHAWQLIMACVLWSGGSKVCQQGRQCQRGLPIDLSLRLYHLLVNKSDSPCQALRFSATYQTRHMWSQNGQITLSATVAIEANVRGISDHVQQIAANMQGMDVRNVQLSYKGQLLANGKNLSSYGIAKDSALLQTASVHGGSSGLACKPFVDVTRYATLSLTAMHANAIICHVAHITCCSSTNALRPMHQSLRQSPCSCRVSFLCAYMHACTLYQPSVTGMQHTEKQPCSS